MKRSNSGASFVGILVTFAIIAFAAVVFINDPFDWIKDKEGRADGQGETAIGRSLLAAQDDKCRSNLRQLRMKVTMLYDTTQAWPAGLQETALNGNFYNCPVGGEDYTYDAETGEVKCPHAGHEKF